MREVDEALARAYAAERAQSDLPQGVPPAPHLAGSRSQIRARSGIVAPEPDHRSSCNGLRLSSPSNAIGACGSNAWLNFCWLRGSIRV